MGYGWRSAAIDFACPPIAQSRIAHADAACLSSHAHRPSHATEAMARCVHPQGKARTMKANYAILQHQVSNYKKEVGMSAKYAWARGDGTGNDESDWATLVKMNEGLESIIRESSFNDNFMSALGAADFKKTALEPWWNQNTPT